MIGRLGVLLVGTLLFWLLVSYPAWRLLGDTHLVYSAVSLALCVVPAALTLLLDRLVVSGGPEAQLGAVVAGMIMRMAVVLGGGLALSSFLSYFQEQAFWLWVVVFYLYTLTLEMVLIVRARSALEQPTNEI